MSIGIWGVASPFSRSLKKIQKSVKSFSEIRIIRRGYHDFPELFQKIDK
jgi:hypothetical protein